MPTPDGTGHGEPARRPTDRQGDVLGACDDPGTWAFTFATAGAGRTHPWPWQHPLEAMLAERGFTVIGSFICRGFDARLPLRVLSRVNRGHPDSADLARSRAFAEMVATRAGLDQQPATAGPGPDPSAGRSEPATPPGLG